MQMQPLETSVYEPVSASDPTMVMPSETSTTAFVAVVLFIVVAVVTMIHRAVLESPRRRQKTVLAALIVAGWAAATWALAEFGVLAALRGSPKLVLYLLASNGLALGLALSPVGRRMAMRVPVAWLLAFQGFRLPLELILHTWYEQGTVPVQITFEGHNFDIVTGILGLSCGAIVYRQRLGLRATRAIVLGFNIVGIALLAVVMSIAVRSTPWPLRTYMNEPSVQLVFYAPYTWILPFCVAGALLGHVVLARWLILHRPTPEG